jgi:hypothetical protein
MTDFDALSFVETLASRGVTLRARGRRIEVLPKAAYGEMSVEDRQTLKRHKAAIAAIAKEGRYAPVVQPQASKTPPAPCPHCYRSPCVGEGHPHYFELHPLSERQIFERGQAQLKHDIEEKMTRLKFGLPSPTWDVPPPSTLADLLDRRARGEEG